MAVLLAVEACIREMGWAIFTDSCLTDTGRFACVRRQQGTGHGVVEAILLALNDVIATCQPREVASAQPFRNQWPVSELDELAPAMQTWADRHGLPLFVYTPREVRAGIAGRANAPKEDLAYAVMRRWGLVGVAKSTIEWNAIAAGDYHLNCRAARAAQ